VETNLDTLRFSFRRKIGSGAMGEVYEGFDHHRGMPLALKRLHHVDASGLLFLKNEFRSLADIAHPNLVALHELVADDNGWFFTMELVAGVPFQVWVRGSDLPAPSTGSTSTALGRTFQEVPVDEGHSTIDDHTFATPGPAPARGDQPVRRGSAPPDLERLRDAYRQLAEGVHALHRARRLHRDLKPSNVLVEGSGRVVILDFGLVLDLDADGGRRLPAAGTAAYMSPEQARRAPLGPASDWYAFGTMLYESLTGHRPFEGQIARVIADKQTTDAVAADRVADGLPADLVGLCTALLDRDPAKRPSGAEIVAQLGGRVEAIEVEVELVGRDAHRAQLREAWRTARLGQPRFVQIRGRSGMGKSSLVEAFLAEAHGEGTVLAGRCYERESVPYKAFDSLIDAVAGILEGWDDERVTGLGIADLQALARLFPALGRVAAIRDLPELEIVDPQELRRRAGEALVALLLGLAPVAVFVDDVQWADRDSAVLFRHLLGVRGSVLLIVAWREEDEGQSAFLNAMERAAEGTTLPIVAVHVGELSLAEGALLAARLAPDAAPDVIEGIARESGGSPMFVAELARAVGSRGAGAVDLDGAIQERVGRLPAGAQKLAELLAVSGRPTQHAVLGAAAAGDWLTDLAQLRAGRLARSSGERIETYHDRVREAIAAGLSDETRRERHRALAEAYELFSLRDPDLLLVHLEAAGLPGRAAPYALLAAARAESALAFEHAARLYRTARGLKSWSGDELRAIDRSLGDALASAGRGAEAADAFVAATEGDPDAARAAALRRRAAEELLQAGHVERGREAFRAALADLGTPMAPDGAAAIASLVWQKARMGVRGMRWKPRTTPVPEAAAARIDLCWSAARAFAFIDYLQAADLGTRSLRLALDAGDPGRVARALILESGQVAASGGPANAAAAGKLLAEAEVLAQESGDPNLEGHLLLGRAIAAYMDESWRECVDFAVRAEDVLLNRCRRASWEVAQCRLFQLWSRVWLGQLDVLAQDYERLLAQAEERGNLFFAANLRADIGYLVHVMRDDPAAGEVAVAEVETRWSRSGFHLQHYNFAVSRSLLALYRGEVQVGMDILAGMVRKFRWSLLSTSGILQMEIAHLRARTAWAVCASANPPPKAALAELKSASKALDRLSVPGAAPHRSFYHGVLASLASDPAGAIRHTEAALAQFEALEYHLHAAAMRRHLGLLMGGTAGADHVAAAEGWLAGMGVVNPGGLCRMYSGADPRV
jgi:serine/threonine protein kinase